MRFLSIMFLIVWITQVPQCLLLTQANQTRAQQIDPNGVYRLTNSYAGPGKSLTVNPANLAVEVADNTNRNNQLWKVVALGGGKYRLINVAAGDKKSLDNSMNNGQYSVTMGDTGDYSGQLWTLTAQADGSYRLVNDYAGQGKSLDSRMSGGGQFAVVMGDTGNYSGQFWTLTKTTLPATVSDYDPNRRQPATVTINVPNIPRPTGTPFVITGTAGPGIDVTPTRAPTPSPNVGSEPVYMTLWNPLKIPSGGGSMLCSVDLRVSHEGCGFTKADWIGKHQVNTTCAKGFYDPIWGGTCWDFPKDDGNGTWLRGTDHPVTAEDAVWRVPLKETFSRADEMRLGLSWTCDTANGEFWDAVTREGAIGGGCWKCPKDYPRRTGYRVDATNACATSNNETAPAVLLDYNGCPKPDRAAMNLTGKRMPGRPFLDVGSGCYACPNSDEDGNILVTARNANPIAGGAYDNNQGCTILFKWKPPVFPEPGMSGMLGVKDVLFENLVLDNPDILTTYLTDLGKEKGFQPGTPQSIQYVAQQWGQIAATPYESPALASFVFKMLEHAADADAKTRTKGEELLVKSMQQYVKLRRKFVAEQALAMYDAWSAYDEKTREWRKQSRLEIIGFDYGTVPLDFQSAASAGFGLTAIGVGVAGTVVGANQHHAGLVEEYWNQVEITKSRNARLALVELTADEKAAAWSEATRLRNVDKVLRGIRGFRTLTSAQLAIAGPALLIEVVGIILQSIAIDQFIAIQGARDKLLAAVTEAKKEVDLKALLDHPFGKDEVTYFWSKALDTRSAPEDPQVVAKAQAAFKLAKQNGFKLSSGQ